MEGIRENGHIFHSYYFKNKLDDNVIEKFSYAVYYEPFHWIIATGETLEEIYEYSKVLNDDNVRHTMILVCIFIVLFAVFFDIVIRIIIKQGEIYREQLQKQAEVLDDIYITLSVGLVRVGMENQTMTVIKINPKALALFGVDSETEIIEKGLGLIDSKTNVEYSSFQDISKELKEKWDYVVVEGYVTWKDGSKHLLQLRNTLIELDGDTKIIQHICQDITEERRQQEEAILQAEEKATLDPMTQIKNKKAIEAITRSRIQEAVEKNLSIAIGFIDIDNFRNYNTLYGHLQGDAVIKYVASVLKETVHGDVGRNGGDEFTFCILDTSYEEVEKAMKEMHQKLNMGIPILETGEIIPTPCSIGVVIEQSKDMDYETLVKSSDEAMYRAKEKGKNTYFILEK